jgi:hypothetical protein
MSKKRNRKSKNSKPMQQFKSSARMKLPKPDELDPDEIGVILDPQNPTRVHSYIFADGTHLKLDNSTVPAKVPPLEPSLIVTSMDNRGSRNTLAYHFGEMLVAAQDLFGPRNTSFLFLGFEFIPEHPRVRYVTDYSAVIQLSFRAMMNPIEAYSELAHECVHLLSPHPYRPVRIIEEGMASVFSRIYLREKMNVQVRPISHQYYDEAAKLVTALLEIDRYGIRKMREEQPDTRQISKPLILKYFPTISEDAATRLARTFVNDNRTDPDILAWYEEETPSASR